MKDEAYLELLRRVILGDAKPENVILLEIEPEKQKTRIDFACTEALLGVRPVCLTKIRNAATQLFYERDGTKVRIERIYNRVIFDELLRRPELESAIPLPGRTRRGVGRSSELVFPDQQTFAAIPENGAHCRRLFSRTNFRLTNRSTITCSNRSIPLPVSASTWNRRRKNSRALEKPQRMDSAKESYLRGIRADG